MITVKASQRIFTHAEVANLTGICADHLSDFAKRHRLGFIARAVRAPETQLEDWLFTPWDLTVLVSLFPRCTH
jgi:hypothetical protein